MLLRLSPFGFLFFPGFSLFWGLGSRPSFALCSPWVFWWVGSPPGAGLGASSWPAGAWRAPLWVCPALCGLCALSETSASRLRLPFFAVVGLRASTLFASGGFGVFGAAGLALFVGPSGLLFAQWVPVRLRVPSSQEGSRGPSPRLLSLRRPSFLVARGVDFSFPPHLLVCRQNSVI